VEASRTRVRCAWGEFNELASILTQRGASSSQCQNYVQAQFFSLTLRLNMLVNICTRMMRDSLHRDPLSDTLHTNGISGIPHKHCYPGGILAQAKTASQSKLQPVHSQSFFH